MERCFLKLNVDGTSEVLVAQDDETSLSVQQAAVGGLIQRLIEAPTPMGNIIDVNICDDGLDRGMTANLWGIHFHAFVGPAVISTSDRVGRPIPMSRQAVEQMKAHMDGNIKEALHGVGLESIVGQGIEAVQALNVERLQMLGLHPGEPDIIVTDWPDGR